MTNDEKNIRWYIEHTNPPVYVLNSLNKAIEAIERDPKTGRWIKISSADIYECSTCGEKMITPKIKAYKFCPNCGAKMEGRENGK